MLFKKVSYNEFLEIIKIIVKEISCQLLSCFRLVRPIKRGTKYGFLSRVRKSVKHELERHKD